jgi:hypothetical protein
LLARSHLRRPVAATLAASAIALGLVGVSQTTAADSSAEVILASAVLTYGGDEPLEGWSFDVAVTDGAPSNATLTTNDEGAAFFTVHVSGSSARIEVTQTATDPYTLDSSRCFDEHGTVGTRGAPMLAFDAVSGHRYVCSFVYFEPSSSVAEVWATSFLGELKHLKTTRHIAVTGGQPDYDSIPNPNHGFILITFAPGPAKAHVEITEDRVSGVRLTDAGCSVREFGEETGGTGRLVGSTLVFNARPRHHYFCSLNHVRTGDARPTTTLAPTDASGVISSRASGSSNGIVLIAALLGSALGFVYVIRKRTSRRCFEDRLRANG